VIAVAVVDQQPLRLQQDLDVLYRWPGTIGLRRFRTASFRDRREPLERQRLHMA